MSHSHGTRAAASSTILIPTHSPVPPPSPLLSTSVVKQRRGSISQKKELSSSSQKGRRLSSSSKARGLELSVSLPSSRKSFAMSSHADYSDEEDYGEVVKTGKKQDRNGFVFECEKCNKAYKNSNSLIKHRWEHTSHWQEALSLSKHAQVQLLEASAVLFAGTSLPEEKSLWPAAFSPPQSGLLGSDHLNFALLTSPRISSSLSLRSLPDEDGEDGDEPVSDDISIVETSPTEEDEEETEDDDNMFDMDMDAEVEDEGYGSVPIPPINSHQMESGLSVGFGALGLTAGELDLGRPVTSYTTEERTRIE